MPHAEISAFVLERQLAPGLEGALEALFARLASSLVPTTFGGERSIEPPPLVSGGSADAVTEELTRVPGAVPPRYDDLGRLGVGGMGEVRRVRDRELGRTCAYKVIRGDLAANAGIVARFVEEAQVGAQLQHPNIAPVYDAGRLPDGRAWFTMKEVRGRTLTELVQEVHADELTDAAFRRLGEVFAKVCDGVGYAHARGVVHRDLKPENVMVGAHGEVLVLDWGLAKVLGRKDLALEEGSLEPDVVSERSADESQRTRVGGVLGTAAYMSPEQARGEVDKLDARSDVYALGAMLYEVLSGGAPYRGRGAGAVLQQVLAGPPDAPGWVSELEPAGLPLPEELVALCEQCMAREPADRPADGAAVATLARAWLDGSKKRDKALEVVAAAEGVVAEIVALRERAAGLRSEGAAMLSSVKAWDPEEEKAAGWAKQDQAEQDERTAALLELRREGLLEGALTHAPELPEAHAALAEQELARHRAAEEDRESQRAARAEVRLRDHAFALPEGHAVRRRAAVYLRGDGALTLATDPEGAEVELYEHQTRNRRLVAVPVRSLGRTPLREVSLPRGSYLCLLRSPGRADVRYPVSLARGDHWDGIPPGEREPHPIHLPLAGALGPDDCLVPAGWFWSGGDPEASDSLPRRRLWCDALVVKRFPVTNRDYLVFLDDLVATGREAEAVRHAPKQTTAMGEGVPVFGRDTSGRFVLRPDPEGHVWDPDYPVLLVDWFGASAYAAWLADRSGRPWRLLGELEWEKAARGADGRFHPWGDGFDPSWCLSRLSHAGPRMPAVVDSYPVDESVYGVRGLAGNVEDWCADEFRREGPRVEGDRVVRAAPDPAIDASVARVRRGGVWVGMPRNARSASRNRDQPTVRYEILGFRVAFRPVEG